MKRIEKCRVCGEPGLEKLFFSQGHEIVLCTTCHTVRTSNFHEPSYTQYHRDDEYASSELFFKYIFQKRFEIVTRFKSTPGSVLDIGAATGVLLDVFKEAGWKTYGIEPSESAHLAQKKGHTIFNTPLEETHITQKFDVIIANHVLEHIENPKHFLDLAQKLLKKDGILYIDVPNFGGVRSRVMMSNWPYLLPTEHVHHFTLKSLSYLLETSGFEVVFETSRSGVFETSRPFEYLLQELIHLKKNFFNDLLSFPVDLFVTMLNRGDSIGIVSKIKID
jgi:2-polyprenyl-3-methyl-5-hydroxy-6-metoxy-1,4-benzoquinol methylase